VEGVGDYGQKLLTHCGSAESVLKLKPNNLQQLTEWELIYLKCKGSVGFDK
jgi:hypothetical protein